MLHAVTRRLHFAAMLDRLDPDARYRDGEVALAAAVAGAVTPAELDACAAVAAGELDVRALGAEPSRGAVELASVTLVEQAGVRWGEEGWAVADGP